MSFIVTWPFNYFLVPAVFMLFFGRKFGYTTSTKLAYLIGVVIGAIITTILQAFIPELGMVILSVAFPIIVLSLFWKLQKRADSRSVDRL